MICNGALAVLDFNWREKECRHKIPQGRVSILWNWKSFTFHHHANKEILFSTRYEEAEVRKKLEEKDRQEKEQLQRQKRQEAGIEDGGTSAKSSLESVLDSKDKTRKVFHIYSER